MKRAGFIAFIFFTFAAAFGAADTGNLASALREARAVDRLGALISALEQTPRASASMVRCLDAELTAAYGKNPADKTFQERLNAVWQKRPGDLRSAELILLWASQSKESPVFIRQWTRETLLKADLQSADDEEQQIFFRMLDFYENGLLSDWEFPAAAEFYDLLVKKYPRKSRIAAKAAELWAQGCFRDTDTAPGLRNWEKLSSDNVWKKRLRNLSGNVSNLCIENGDDAVAYSLLARWLYDRKLMKKAVDIRQQVPVLKCSGEAALPALGINMKMPELCYQVPYDMLPVYLAAAGDIDGAERALANVPEAARNDLRMIVMLHKKNYVGIRQILKNEKVFPRTSMAFQAACVAAIKLKDTALLEQIISGLPAVSAEKLPPDICNILGYSGAELSYKLPESEKFVAAALKSDPTSFSYLDSMAWVLFKQGKYSEARKYIGQAVKCRDADPNVAVVFLHAAGIEFAATGDKAASRSYLERAEKLVTAEICDYDPEYAAKLKELLK